MAGVGVVDPIGHGCARHGKKYVSGKNLTTSFQAASSQLPRLQVLLVNREPEVYNLLVRCTTEQQMQLIQAANLAEARRQVAESSVDLVLIDSEQPDGSGIELARELSHGRTAPQTIIISGRPSYESAVGAIRAGAIDLLIKPLDAGELDRRLRQAQLRHQSDYQARWKVMRLKRVCKKLNQVRRDVKQQVDILCKDLVAGYHELAVQMNQIMQCSEYSTLIRSELDLEELLRKTLEFLLHKAGPTNAAIFLPSRGDEFTVSGYVNYDCTSDAADFLLQHLADVIAPRAAQLTELVHLCDPETVMSWIGQEIPYLVDSHLIVFACWEGDEPLAVITLFREKSEPFDPGLLEICQAIGPLLGDRLAKLIRVHHRHLIDEEDDFGAPGNAA